MANFGGSAYETIQLGVTANPVIDKNEVYDAYLQFLAEPGHLIKTCEPPPPGAAHITRCYDKEYYWVPTEYKYDFLRLALVTTAQRGQPLTVPVKFDNTVVSANLELSSGTQHRFIVNLSQPLPNSSGRMDALVNGSLYHFPLQMYSPLIPKPGEAVTPPGQDTNKFLVVYNEKQVPVQPADFTKALAGQNVKIDLDFFKPTVPNTEKLLESIRNETQLIRFNQFNPPVPAR
jgi:hypothetical protein